MASQATKARPAAVQAKKDAEKLAKENAALIADLPETEINETDLPQSESETQAKVSTKLVHERGQKTKIFKMIYPVADVPKSKYASIDISKKDTARLQKIKEESLRQAVQNAAEYEKQIAAVNAAHQQRELDLKVQESVRIEDVVKRIIEDDEDAEKTGVMFANFRFLNVDLTTISIELPQPQEAK